MTTASLTPQEARRALLAEEFGAGLQQWSPQAWLDFVMARILIHRVSDVIPKTYLPILRLVCDDPAKADADYAAVVTLREPVRLFDAPREKWRKLYGAYIRELEWVFGELRKHFPAAEYQELVIDIMARRIRDWLGAFLPTLEASTRSGDARLGPHVPGQEPGWMARRAAKAMERVSNGRVGRWLMSHLNPASFMVGPVEMKMQPGGELEMSITRCWMHTAPCDGQTQDQACVQACKGACERVFGPDSIAPMILEPHLPDYSCTIWIKLGGGQFASEAVNAARHPANKAAA